MNARLKQQRQADPSVLWEPLYFSVFHCISVFRYQYANPSKHQNIGTSEHQNIIIIITIIPRVSYWRATHQSWVPRGLMDSIFLQGPCWAKPDGHPRSSVRRESDSSRIDDLSTVLSSEYQPGESWRRAGMDGLHNVSLLLLKAEKCLWMQGIEGSMRPVCTVGG